MRAFCCSFQHSPKKKILYRGKDTRAQSAGCDIEKSKVQVARLTTGCDDLCAKMKRGRKEVRCMQRCRRRTRNSSRKMPRKAYAGCKTAFPSFNQLVFHRTVGTLPQKERIINLNVDRGDGPDR